MSPLSKRIPRDLRHNLGKYLGLFALIVLVCAMVSSFLTGARSIQVVVADARAAANLEDFQFTTQFEASDRALAAAQELMPDAAIYENFSSDVSFEPADGSQDTVRLYVDRTDFDRAVYYTGRAPETDSEIAIDRVFANNHRIQAGDTVQVAGRAFTVSGICVLTDYQVDMVRNTDLMFDSQAFCVGQVTTAAFDSLAGDAVTYRYSVVLGEDMPVVDRTTLEEDVARALDDAGAQVTDLVDVDDNSAVTFSDDDIEGDQQMWVILCGVLMIVCAFVFVVLTNATIESESSVIGTLLANGYRKRELVAHYLAMPVIVGVAAVAVGNLVGLVGLVDYMAGMYYGSYNLPPFTRYFFPDVFLLTSVLPLALLVAVTFIGIVRKLSATPLAFLRHEVGRTSRHANLALPARLGFTHRFRIRVFLRNASHFAVLFVGVMFSLFLLIMGVCMLPAVQTYAQNLASTVPAEHLYLLKAPLEIDGTDEERAEYKAALELADSQDPLTDFSPSRLVELYLRASEIDEDAHPVNTTENSPEALASAEKFCVTSLEVPRALDDSSETVSVYGIQEGSRYWDYDVSGGKVLVGGGFAKKTGMGEGDTVTFTDHHTGDTYDLVIAGVVGKAEDTNVYMSMDTWRQTFDEDADYFNGYASDEPLELDGLYVASEITPADMGRAGDQLEDSMGDVMGMISVVSVAVTLVLIYLLTKTVIEHSARYIAYLKVFGYRDREISALYVRSITVTVVASFLVALPIDLSLFSMFADLIMASYQGYLPMSYDPVGLAECLALGLAAYAVVAALHVRHIKRVSLSDALKVQE